MEKEILDLFRECSEVVEERLEQMREEDYGVEKGMGADGTPMKAVDEAAEKAAIEHIQDETDMNILTEESGAVAGDKGEERGEEEGTIIMDPIDGTSNASMGIPFYCISLAYTPSGFSNISLAYIKNIPTGKEYHAIKGHGSYVDGKKMSPELREERGESDWNFSVYMGKKAADGNSRIASIPRRTRTLGSAALEISMVAEGIFDLYYLRTPERKRSLRPMDIAAATLILREAGGEVYDGEMKPIDMDLGPKQRKDVIALYDEEVKEKIEEVIG